VASSEIRNPKSEIRIKPQIPSANPGASINWFSISSFGHLDIASHFRFRISDLSFRLGCFAAIVLAILSCFTSICSAQPSVTLPLEGWYRVGRYMPARLGRTENAASTPISTISATGAVPTEFEFRGNASTIVPLLIYSAEAGQLAIDQSPFTNTPLRALASHQQLVAVAGGGDRLSGKLFPGELIVIIHVDPLDPLPGPALAWQTLDALIIDGPWPGSFDIHKLPGLLAGGTEVAVRSPDRPNDALPWEAIDGGWVLRPPIVGPLGCDGSDEAYVPVMAWHPDLTAPERHRVVLFGVLFSLAALACFLLPRRSSLPVLIVVTFGAMIGIVWWQVASASTDRAGGDVIVEHNRMTQLDHWQFVTSRGTASAQFDCIDATWPIFADAQQAPRLGLSLYWSGDGGRFRFSLPRDGKLAFVSRVLQPYAPVSTTAVPSSIETPMTALVRALYSRGRGQIDVEPGAAWHADDAAPLWPTAIFRPGR
jgi:hypothetical protein